MLASTLSLRLACGFKKGENPFGAVLPDAANKAAPAQAARSWYALRVPGFVSKLVVCELYVVNAKAVEAPGVGGAQSIRYVLVRYSHRFALASRSAAIWAMMASRLAPESISLVTFERRT